DSLFVLDDADPVFAARAAWFGATINRGQTCIAVRRVFVARPRYQEFVAALEPLVKAGAPMRLALSGEVKQAERLVQEATAEGARIVTASQATADRDQSYLPTAVFDAKPEMGLCREAIFAPVLAVMPFEVLDDAVRMDRQCRYGLGASVFTGN